jgi:thiol:disulfide interchange protein DsbD
LGTLLSGVLATTVATPCTGPFLGSAIGFAMTLTPIYSLLIFTSLGLGMASPYLIIAAFPSLIRLLPKPGDWMVSFKEFMGFCMLATSLWLLWVFGAQTDQMAVFALLFGFLLLSLSCWVYGKWGSPVNHPVMRYVSYAVALCLLGGGIYTIVNASLLPRSGMASEAVHEGWENFSKEKLDQYRSQGKPVLVDFTAKWCLICQTNHVVLSLNDVSQKMDKLGVVKMKADWTRYDPAITAELAKYGRNGVPLYLLFPADPKAEPYVLPQMLTPDVVSDYLEKITPSNTSQKSAGITFNVR